MEAKKWQVYLLLWARCALQAARLAVAPLLVFIQAEYGFDTIVKGKLLAAFPAGYLLTQVVGGSISDRIGGKPVMTMSLIATAACTAAIPVAVSMGDTALWFILFLDGMLQGPTFPTNAVILGRWIPPAERSWANSLTEAGSPLGGLIAMGISPLLCTAFGWRQTCTMFAVAVMGFTVLWQSRAASTPSSCSYITKEEMDELSRTVVVDDGKNADTKAAPMERSRRSLTSLFQIPHVPLVILLHPSALAVFASHAIYNFGRYFLYFWMPSFFNEELGLSPKVAGFYLILPELCGAVFTAVGGWLATEMAKKEGASLLHTRKLFSIVGFVGAGSAMLILAVASGPGLACLALCLEGSLNAMHGSGFKANYQDLTTTYRGAVSGAGNTVATMASTFGPLLIARLLSDYQSWPMNFIFIASVFYMGAVIYARFADVASLDRLTDGGDAGGSAPRDSTGHGTTGVGVPEPAQQALY
eukprot:m.609471 g.609471  ORF g.609471 m.609471 type:complete len:472 (-) comp22489_c0_seq6:1685-3100(-)